MPDCPFCLIARGDIPAAKVYENDHVLAFLDINPLADGHTLVIPKQHAAKLGDTAPDTAAALMTTTRRLVPAVCAAVDAPDATLAIHDGPAAGQEVPHLHLHIVPRKPGDGAGPIHSMFSGPRSADKDRLTALAGNIRDRLG